MSTTETGHPGEAIPIFGREAPSIPLDLVITPSADKAMGEIAAKLGVGKADVLSWGLAILKVAMDAKEEGKKLAIVDQAGNVTAELGL